MALAAARAIAGEGKVQELPQPTMGGEDFSFMLNASPGTTSCSAPAGGRRTRSHHPKYDFNDAVLPIGASYWATLAEQLLPRRD